MRTNLNLLLALTLCLGAWGCGDDGESCTAGTKDCECKEGNTCDGSLVCQNNKCVEDTGACQTDYVYVKGNALAMDGTPGEFALAPVSPTQVLFNPDGIVHITDGTSNATTGAFEFDCFDVSTVSMGLVILVDDVGFDGTAGDFYPTVAGVAAFPEGEPKESVDDAVVFGIPNTFVTGISALPGMDLAQYGFAMGFVADHEGNPVEGAVIKMKDAQDNWVDMDPNPVYYPNATMTDFVTGTATSANGIYIIPGPLPGAITTDIKPEKAGLTWDGIPAAAVKNLCYMVNLKAKDPNAP